MIVRDNHHIRQQHPLETVLVLTTDQPTRIVCLAVGNSPISRDQMLINFEKADVTDRKSNATKSEDGHDSVVVRGGSGVRGLRLMEYTTAVWSYQFVAKEMDDGKAVTCIVNQTDIGVNMTRAKIAVICESL